MTDSNSEKSADRPGQPEAEPDAPSGLDNIDFDELAKLRNVEEVQEPWSVKKLVKTFKKNIEHFGSLAASILFHLIIVALFITVAVEGPRKMEKEIEVFMVEPDAKGPPPPPRPPPSQQTQQTREMSRATASQRSSSASKYAVKALSAPGAGMSAANFARIAGPSVAPATSIKAGDIKVDTGMTKKITQQNVARVTNVRDFQKDWGVQGSGTRVKAKFTIFQAKYKGGDWNCNPESLQNMMLQIKEWSKDRIDPNLAPEVLDVGTDKLFTLKPPFVYLTGHRDFTLLDNEVKNIRDYLMLGGAVWADSALAGRRSRFDVAFRREMGRVFPDREFEELNPDHELFDSFFQNTPLPSGMNFYHEPAEVINIGEHVAVIYTLNGYGHFWESRLNRDNKIEFGRINVNMGTTNKPLWRHVYGPHLSGVDSRIIFRNINNTTVRDAYKFGINVVVHLLTRYQKQFLFLPKELPKTGAGAKPATASAAVSSSNAATTSLTSSDPKDKKADAKSATTVPSSSRGRPAAPTKAPDKDKDKSKVKK